VTDYTFSTFVETNHPQVTKADPTVKGTAPFRAAAHCEPFRLASAIGWWIYPPCDFSIIWDGSDLRWLHENSSTWVTANSLTLGHMASATELFTVSNEAASRLQAIVALPEPGYVQVWTGLTVESPDGWCSLVRSAPNFASHTSYDMLEGVIETDWWHGPLLLNLRVRQTATPISFRRTRPMAAVMPVFRDHINSSQFSHTLNTTEDGSSLIDALSVRDPQQPGGYARASRQRSRVNRHPRSDETQ